MEGTGICDAGMRQDNGAPSKAGQRAEAPDGKCLKQRKADYMIHFQRVKITDRAVLHGVYFNDGKQNSEYSFANLFMWGRQQFAVVEGCVCAFSHWDGKSLYLYPEGDGDKRAALEALMQDAEERGIPFRLYGLSPQEAEQLQTMFPERFRLKPVRDSFDYVYDIDRLANLKGRKLQQKRNHINRFIQEHPDWTAEVITPELLPECRQMAADWYAHHNELYGAEDFDLEKAALRRCFDNYEALEMEGMLIRLDGRIIALTMGNHTAPDTFDVNFEKAYSDIQGAYPLINRTFACYLREKYPQVRFLNREDDMGLPGLRKAKESYHPDLLAEKISAVLLED